MTYPFPTRLTGDPAAEHVEDHTEIHERLGLGLPAVTTSSTGHLEDHKTIHRILNTIFGQSFNESISVGDAGHLSVHNAIASLLNEEIHGPRGAVGQRATTGIADFPTSFTSSHSTFASLQSAVAAAGTGRIFRITASMAFTAPITPHSGDQFWGNDGVTITRSGSINSAFIGSNANPNVRIMNLVISGFNATGTTGGNAADKTISMTDADNWEVGYCDISNTWIAISPSANAGSSATGIWVHHCYLHSCWGPTWEMRRVNGMIFEDNEISHSGLANVVLAVHKSVLTNDLRIRHNYIHDQESGPAVWFDTADTNNITEWNIIDTTDAASGIMHEADSYAWQNQSTLMPATDGNIVRYNIVRNCGHRGIWIVGSRYTEVYGNICYDNNVGNFSTVSEIMLYITPLLVSFEHSGSSSVDCRLEFNHVHHNAIRPASTSKQALRYISPTQYTDGLPFDRSDYLDNTMENNFDYNLFLDNVSTTSTSFSWHDTLKNWTTWRAMPQVNGTGATQDINSERYD